MKTKKIFLSVATAALLSGCLMSCGGGVSKTLTVWVGNEPGTTEFYQGVIDAWLQGEGAKYADYKIEAKGTDVGSISGSITQDPQAAGDIFTVAHDNVGKLASQMCAKPIGDPALTEQILADNPQGFIDVSYSNLNGKSMLYAAPYISQALFLYYDTRVAGPEDVDTFEHLFAKAAENNSKAFTVPSSDGADGYNFSFVLLSTRVEDHYTSLKLYEGAAPDGSSKGECWSQGDDRVATLRWVQDALANENGMKYASADGWDQDVKNGSCFALIGGAWHFEDFATAVGEANVGVALIPTFELQANHVEGLDSSVVKAGDVYRGGTFADCKVFMLNSNTHKSKYQLQQDLVKHLSSAEIQTLAFEKQTIVPANKNAIEGIETLYQEKKVSELQYKLATTQIAMGAWGIPQPFITGSLNTYYYSKNAPAVYAAMSVGNNYPTTGTPLISDTRTLKGIRQGLYLMNYIWLKGKNPTEIPATLPAQI